MTIIKFLFTNRIKTFVHPNDKFGYRMEQSGLRYNLKYRYDITEYPVCKPQIENLW